MKRLFRSKPAAVPTDLDDDVAADIDDVELYQRGLDPPLGAIGVDETGEHPAIDRATRIGVPAPERPRDDQPPDPRGRSGVPPSVLEEVDAVGVPGGPARSDVEFGGAPSLDNAPLVGDDGAPHPAGPAAAGARYGAGQDHGARLPDGAGFVDASDLVTAEGADEVAEAVVDRSGGVADEPLVAPGLDFAIDETGETAALAPSSVAGEQRSAWAYLGLLTGLFCFVVVFGYACSDQRGGVETATDPADILAGPEPARLVFNVDGDVIALQGSVPDDAARQQLVAVAADAYGPENVVDDLVIDGETTFESGTIRFVGSTTFGDTRPEALHELVGTNFGLANRGFEVGFVETMLSPVDATLAVDTNSVVIAGALPDDQSVTDLRAIADEVWGGGNVDSSGLTVGDATWTSGRIRATGSVLATDDRVNLFARLVAERIDSLVDVDRAGLDIVDNAAAIGELQAQVDELVTANPIEFAPTSPEIDQASDGLLEQLAAALATLPDVSFEVVGHTDDVGSEEENLLLSEQRAEAVVARLISLGIDPARMTARGEGEARPVADNATDEGKAANRRIEFILVGTSGAVEGDDS